LRPLSGPRADPNDKAGFGVRPIAIWPCGNRRGKNPENKKEEQDSRHALYWMHARFPTDYATIENRRWPLLTLLNANFILEAVIKQSKAQPLHFRSPRVGPGHMMLDRAEPDWN